MHIAADIANEDKVHWKGKGVVAPMQATIGAYIRTLFENIWLCGPFESVAAFW